MTTSWPHYRWNPTNNQCIESVMKNEDRTFGETKKRRIVARKSISAFIDILGFADTTLAVTSADDLAALEAKVRLVQDAFEFSSKDKSVRDQHVIYKKNVLAFSDCVVVNLPLRSTITKHEGTFDPIMSELVSMAWAQCTCVLEGIFLRGGISLGWWYRSGHRLVSSSLVHAYKFENQAMWPVLALTEDLYGFLANHDHRQFYSEDFDPIPLTFDSFEHPRSNNTVYFLDYLSIWLSSIDWATSRSEFEEYLAAIPEIRNEIMNRGYEQNVLKSLMFHKEAIENALVYARTKKVRAKYEWLAGYHNKVSKRFTRSKKSIIII